MPTKEPVKIAEKLTKITKYWTPAVAGDVDDYEVKLVKMKGEFNWHTHEKEDEFFLVTKGQFVIQFRDRNVTLREGEFFVVPKGLEHCPRAEEEAHVMLLERKTVVNTGELRNEKTVLKPKRI